MNINLKLFLLLFVCTQQIIAQNPLNPFLPLLKNEYHLDSESMKKAIEGQMPIWLPGEDKPVLFVSRTNFEEGLAKKYPEIKSYRSKSYPIIYMDYFENEFTFFKLDEHGATHIICKDKTENRYAIIRAGDHENIHPYDLKFECGTTEHLETKVQHSGIKREKEAETIQLKTYRIAIALTGEFSRSIGVRKDLILSGLNNHLTRINAVYHRENSIEFRLVEKNDTILFLDGQTDPYTNGNAGALMTANPAVLNDYIGIGNYDIGHVFGTNTGGVAQLSSVCTANKGAGSSSTFGVYSGINFYFIACHEIGHQFSAEHTFNLCDNSNETASSAFEPGSGSTLMSYAGASQCGTNYVQDMMDPYFHANSLRQIKAYSRQSTGSFCGTSSLIENKTPDVTILSPSNLTIPIQTPFELEGKGTDDRQSQLAYTWEQMDLGIKSALGNPVGTAPQFRSLTPNLNTIRSFPNLQSVLDNAKDKNEVLPTATRPMNFRFTARDYDTLGGGFAFADYSMLVNQSSGPFSIANYNARDTVFKNDFIKVEWSVANTDQSPVNCKSVDIYWSIDGGINFKLLLGNTTNDGEEWIVVPNEPTNIGRIKIKASNSVFFDINNANITVLNAINTKLSVAPFPASIKLCEDQTGHITLKSAMSTSADTLFIFNDSIGNSYKVTLSKKFITQQDSLLVTIQNFARSGNMSYPINLIGINSRTKDTIKIKIIDESLSSIIEKSLPIFGESQAPVRPVFKWIAPRSGSNDFILELSEQSTFNSLTWFKIVTKTDTIAIPDTDLKTNTVYFWRIRNLGGCELNAATISTFHTQSLVCKNYAPADLPKFISATGTPKINSIVDVADDFPLQLITIPVLRGSHDFIGDLSLYLKAPSGDSIKLWSNECNNLSNFYLSLDDQASVGIMCPLTDRKPHQPVQKLAMLNSSNSKGQWILSIQDTKSGSGGSLDEWTLQLCGAVTQNNPNPRVPPAITQFENRKETLTSANLEYLDNDSSPAQLKYALLDKTGVGVFILNGKDTLHLGSTFTQADINNGKLSFHSFLVKSDTIDSIRIVIVDEKNNWSGVQTLNIKVLNDNTIPSKDIFKLDGVSLFPNPFKDHITMESGNTGLAHIEVFTINGKLVLVSASSSNQVKISTDLLSPGVYIIKVWDQSRKRSRVFKAIKQD